jgi:pimeloyl-ACP methyl ester carboxylesterase
MDAVTPAKGDAASTTPRRVPNGLAYREVGRGQPLLLLHGLMAGGEMFDPLVERLQDDFRMLIPICAATPAAPISAAPTIPRRWRVMLCG